MRIGETHSWSFLTVQSFAAFICGEPVSRGPMLSVKCPTIAITCERRKPSSRMRPSMS